MAITKTVEDAEVTFSVTDDNSITRADVITSIRCIYTLNSTDGLRTFAHSAGVRFDTSDLSTFTPFSDLTQTQVIVMCENRLGSTRVSAIEAQLNADLSEYENPTKEIRQISS